MRTKDTYSVIVPLEFPDDVKMVKEIFGFSSNGAALVYLVDEFKRCFPDAVEKYKAVKSAPVQSMDMKAPPRPEPIF